MPSPPQLHRPARLHQASSGKGQVFRVFLTGVLITAACSASGKSLSTLRAFFCENAVFTASVVFPKPCIFW
jgi:hypothetical protein